MAAKLVKMLKKYRGPDGREYLAGRTYNVSKQVAESWVERTGRAEYVTGYKTDKHHALKAFERAPAHQAHDHPMNMNSNTDTRGMAKPVLKDPLPEPSGPVRSPHKELPDFQVDRMHKDELIAWLDDNLEDHPYDKRFGEKTLREAVKKAVLSKHNGG